LYTAVNCPPLLRLAKQALPGAAGSGIIIPMLLSLVLSAAGFGVYFILLEFGIYRLYPVETYALLLAGTGMALLAATRKGRLWRWALAAGQGLLLLFFLSWTLYFSRMPDHRLAVKPGDAMLDFVLPDQDGQPVSTAALRGKTAALYIFYRGDW
jgi:hypothetical protein